MPSFSRLIVALLPILLAGCADSVNRPTDQPDGGLILRQNEGYSSLYGLMKSESDVDKIFIIKHADPPVVDLVKQIAALAQDAKSRLDAFAVADKRLVYDVNDLPKVEKSAHDRESSETEKSLLSAGGDDFQMRLLFTQAQAMGYASDVAAALADGESNSERKDYLNALSKRCADFRDRAMALLTVKKL